MTYRATSRRAGIVWRRISLCTDLTPGQHGSSAPQSPASGRELTEIATTSNRTSDAERTLAIGRSSYFHLPSGTPLWSLAGTFSDDDPQSIAGAL
jgi:hypothetical protein